MSYLNYLLYYFYLKKIEILLIFINIFFLLNNIGKKL